MVGTRVHSALRGPGLRLGALLLLLLGLLISACGLRHNHAQADLGLTTEEKRWLDAHPVITATQDPYYPPFDMMLPDGTHTGYSADLLSHAGAVLGREFRIVPTASWNDGLALVSDGKIHCISSVVYTEDRARFVAFTQPFFVVHPVFLGRIGQKPVVGPGDLRGKRVLVTRGYAVVEHLQKFFPGISLEYVDNDRLGMLRLAFGEADYAVTDFPVATYTLRQEGITNLRVMGQTNFEYALRFAVPKGDQQLASILDKVFARMGSGEREALTRKWITLEKRFYEYKEFRVVGLVGLALLLGSGLVSWALKRAVNRRTADLQEELVRRRAAEAAISDLNASLYRAVAHAEMANQAKSHFLRMISHEFLTPLNQVQLHAELLEGALREPEARVDLENIRSAARTLADQVVDILELVDLESSSRPLNSKPISGKDLEEALRMRALPWAAANHNALILSLAHLPSAFEGDPEALAQALLKLLHNACRFTHGGIVSLTLHMGPGELSFEIKDTGKGIAPAELDRVFEMFSQGEEGLTRAFGGMGLGLAICQHLVRKMGGRLSVESRLGEGSTFRVHLPMPAR